eukprot:1937383-Karenia_brevis.AAC.1
MMLSTIARCVTAGDCDLANRLISTSKLAARHLGVLGAKTFLHDPIAFEQDVTRARAFCLESQINAIQSADEFKDDACSRHQSGSS